MSQEIFLKERKNEQLGQYSALEIACYIVNYCNKKNYDITHLRLEKILYFAQLYYVKEKNSILFWEDIEAWPVGPIVPEVYHQFRQYCGFLIDPIKEYWDLSEGLWEAKKKKYISCIDQKDKNNINKVINMCEKYSTTELVSISQRQTPWIKAYRRNATRIIPISYLQKFCNDLL